MNQEDVKRARVSQVSIRKHEPIAPKQPTVITDSVKRTWRISEKLTRNFLCAALVVVCVYAVQSSQLPDSAAIMTAMQSVTEDNWDENLGRIQFVSSMFPETLSVFWDSGKPALQVSNDARVLHAWTRDEPYLSISTDQSTAYALANGTVGTIAHDQNERYIVSILHDNNYETVYYDLTSCSVEEGDAITTLSVIGTTATKNVMSFELRQEGLPLNPTQLLDITGSRF